MNCRRPQELRRVSPKLICAADEAGRIRVKAWLARLEVARIQTVIFRLSELYSCMGYKYNSDQRAAVLLDLERAKSMLKLYQARTDMRIRASDLND